ncbi:Type 1 glutamine amidotransferase-like domain-containing protein [Bacteroides reticulotermitis]|uniref:Alpha-aspartyl dipeptidase n=2 Tax=Bacteroides reticulotermitis TaxID=1133319 RepID=W4UX18_9BACE|nr:Type 1 glutamine amidotransferase-like domain-containing protein [Bacteroides reticulotermitis]MBB4043064.1 dipeptidase E [Bacteroides reticulotermitis]GAE85775.1 alpha-aspartyl dipeptidase [Bacteroides reticulotermitis JCM 10512]
MKKLFLTSAFTEVAALLAATVNEDLQGKTVTFIPTASIPESVTFYVGAGKRALKKLGLIVDELELTTASTEEIAQKLKANDYIYVTGGNTFFLLQELKRTGADKILIEQINNGKLYIGESAGSIIMASQIEYVKDMDDCSEAKDLEDFSALNIVDFYPLPHHTNFPFKKAVEKIIAKYETELKLYPFSNSQVLFVDGASGKEIEVITKQK